MKSIEFKQTRIDAIKTPHGFTDVMKSADAKARAESIKAIGVLQPVKVRASDSLLVFGQHRLAGAKIAGLTEIPAEFVECSDVEIREMRIDENLERRTLHPDEIAMLTAEKVAIVKARIEESEAAAKTGVRVEYDEQPTTSDTMSQVSPKRGPARSTDRKARTETAKQLGVTERTVERRQQKAANPEGPPVKNKAHAFEKWGLDIPIETVTKFERLIEAKKACLGHLQEARKIAKLDQDWDASMIATLETMIEASKTAQYHCVCPSCKLHARLQSVCMFCNGVGLVSKAALDAVLEAHPSLAEKADPKVLVGSKLKRLGGNLKWDRLNASNARTLSAEDRKRDTEHSPRR